MNRYPFYIPSKGRFDKCYTSDYLSKHMQKAHSIVIEEQEYKKYYQATKDNPYVTLIVLDKAYQRKYDPCDDLGDQKSKGSGPARNFIWDHSLAEGHSWHWIMDDNIRYFARLNRKIIAKIKNTKMFAAMENFCARYENIGMAGPQYRMFSPRKQKHPYFIYNTRIFSCILIRNDIPFRWRGRYNEDIDLSIRLLKNGWCNILFQCFLQEKIATQVIKGGNTDEIYKDGTLDKSKMIVNLHPDCCKLVKRYGRWHHHSNLKRFKKIKLKRKAGIQIKEGIDEYGMKPNKALEKLLSA